MLMSNKDVQRTIRNAYKVRKQTGSFPKPSTQRREDVKCLIEKLRATEAKTSFRAVPSKST